MSTVAELEASIQSLPAGDFLKLMEWMTDRHLHVVTSDTLASAELEAEILRGLDGPQHEVTASLFDDIRAGWNTSPVA